MGSDEKKLLEGKKNSAINKWNLKNVVTVYEYDSRAVYYAESFVYGQVVLKINLNEEVLKYECNTLREFTGSSCCKVYAYCDGQLLEERIMQGRTLNSMEAVDERLDKFEKAFRSIQGKVEDTSYLYICDNTCDHTYDSYPSYINWLENAYSYCCDNNVEEALSQKMEQALKIGKEMFEKYPDRYLLHGDLHHENILIDANGECKVIDPKGVIGPKIFDTPRYILNELNPDINKTGEAHIRYVINRIAELLAYSEEDVKKLFFMETILGNIWCLEDGEDIDEEDIEVATNILNDVNFAAESV